MERLHLKMMERLSLLDIEEEEYKIRTDIFIDLKEII